MAEEILRIKIPYDEKGFVYLGDNTIIHKDNLIASFKDSKKYKIVNYTEISISHSVNALQIDLLERDVENGVSSCGSA